MSTIIDNRYGSYYTQVPSITPSNANKTEAASIDTTDKVTSRDTYFKNLCNKYSNVNLNMSDSHLNQENKITYNISPALISKASSDPKAAGKLNELLGQAQETEQYINSHKSLDGNSEVKSVSFSVDENGELSCRVELKSKSSEDTNDTNEKDKLREKKRKELKEKTKRLKESEEKDTELTEKQKVTSYYNNVVKGFGMNLFDTNM